MSKAEPVEGCRSLCGVLRFRVRRNLYMFTVFCALSALHWNPNVLNWASKLTYVINGQLVLDYLAE
jgi:hypothetical protein